MPAASSCSSYRKLQYIYTKPMWDVINVQEDFKEAEHSETLVIFQING